MQSNESVKLLLDLNHQPISNRYLVNRGDEEQLFPLKLGQCQETGLIQLIDPVPYKELVPRFDWITYNEPEDHLDDLVEKIYKILPKDRSLNIGGVSFKDDSTLERFSRKGCETWRANLRHDLSLDNHVGVESIQAALTESKAKTISERYGKADLLVVRHIWEHIYDQDQFAEGLKGLVSDDGYVLFEIPDCTNLLESFDCTMIWEEHLYYYTPHTVKQSLQQHGFEILGMDVVPYPGENSIILFVKVNNSQLVEVDQRLLTMELQMGEQYTQGFGDRKTFILEYLDRTKNGGKVAVFGAGHLACAFMAFLGLGKYVSFMADDNPNKEGLFMPKSRVPVVSSKELLNTDISLCLLAMNSMNDEKMMSNLRELAKRGTQIRSIFPSSKYSIFKESMS